MRDRSGNPHAYSLKASIGKVNYNYFLSRIRRNPGTVKDLIFCDIELASVFDNSVKKGRNKAYNWWVLRLYGLFCNRAPPEYPYDEHVCKHRFDILSYRFQVKSSLPAMTYAGRA